MSGSFVRAEVDGPVCTIVLDRPAVRNAVDGPMAAELLRAFEAFEADEALRVAVLCGAGGHFCAGADLTAVGDPARRHELDPEGGGSGPMGPTRMALSKPLVAAVSGYAVAGGLELALLADLRVMERDAVFGVFCRRWGVPLIDGGTVRLPRIVGMGRALDLILTGRPVGAEEALAMGLANRLVEPGAARQTAEILAREIAAFPQRCMLADRASAYGQWDLPLAQALRNEGAQGVPVVFEEAVAGAARFVGGAGRHGRQLRGRRSTDVKAGPIPTITAFEQSPDRGRGLARDMRVRWALEEVGQPYDVRLVSFKAMKESAHRARHPFGQIPTYEEGDLVLFESGAIVLHIAGRHAGLLPEAEPARALAIAWMFSALNTMEPPILDRAYAMLLERDKPWHAERLPVLEDRVRSRLGELSSRLGDADWLAGAFSAGDLLMVTVLRRLSSSALLDAYPKLGAYVARGEARPAYRRAFADQLAVFTGEARAR